MRLERELRKVEMNYDEEMFNKKWATENFESRHLQTTVRELETELKK